MTKILDTARSATSWDPDVKEFVDELRILLKSADGKLASNPQIFFLAMSVGFYKGVRGPKSPRSSDAARFEYMNEMDVARMRMVAVAESASADVLVSDEDVIDIAEQYANGGLALMRAEQESNPAFSSWLVTELFSQIESFSGHFPPEK